MKVALPVVIVGKSIPSGVPGGEFGSRTDDATWRAVVELRFVLLQRLFEGGRRDLVHHVRGWALVCSGSGSWNMQMWSLRVPECLQMSDGRYCPVVRRRRESLSTRIIAFTAPPTKTGPTTRPHDIHSTALPYGSQVTLATQ